MSTTVAPSRIVAAAVAELGDAAPVNSCVRLGMRRWPAQVGLPVIDSDSVTEWERQARRGVDGWSYHEGTAGIREGDFGDWDPKHLAHSTDRHVSIVEQLQGGRWRGIGAGTPSGRVAYQPAGGGYNVLDVLRGYFRPPTSAAAVQAPAKPAPKPATSSSGGREHVVVKGDTLWDLARHYGVSQQRILKANPPLPTRRSADYHIASPSLITIGQRIRIPS